MGLHSFMDILCHTRQKKFTHEELEELQLHKTNQNLMLTIKGIKMTACQPQTAESLLLNIESRFFGQNQHKGTLINQGDIIFELGAYLGFYSLYLCNQVGLTGEVHAVEILKENYEILKYHLELNFPNTGYAYHYGISNQDTELSFFYDSTITSQVNSFKKKVVSYYTKPAESKVKAIKLDTLIEQSDVKHIDLIILQINGSEIDALKSFTKWSLVDNFFIALPYHNYEELDYIFNKLHTNGFLTEYINSAVYATRQLKTLPNLSINLIWSKDLPKNITPSQVIEITPLLNFMDQYIESKFTEIETQLATLIEFGDSLGISTSELVDLLNNSSYLADFITSCIQLYLLKNNQENIYFQTHLEQISIDIVNYWIYNFRGRLYVIGDAYAYLIDKLKKNYNIWTSRELRKCIKVL